MADVPQNEHAAAPAPEADDNDPDMDQQDDNMEEIKGNFHAGAVNDVIVPDVGTSTGQLEGSDAAPTNASLPHEDTQVASSTFNDDNQGGDSDDSASDTDESESDASFEGKCKDSCEPRYQRMKNQRDNGRRRETRLKRRFQARLDRQRRIDKEREDEITAGLRAQLEAERLSNEVTRNDNRNLQNLVAYLNREVRRLNAIMARLKGDRRNRRKTETTWGAELVRYCQGEGDVSYRTIYRRCCSEENSSWKYLHPLMKLVGRSEDEDEEDLDSEPGIGASGGTAFSSGVRTTQRGRRLFAQFPLHILGNILRCAVVFDGQPVHVVTRLDPHRAPDVSNVLPDMIELDQKGQQVRRLHRFLIGSGEFRLSEAPDPNVVLAPLLVCKKWCYIACNLFYSHNLFCFSSFGELGWFMDGIGARKQRIQHIELFWIGSQDVTFKINDEGKVASRRMWPLLQLVQANRLKTLHVYLRESSRAVMRRPNEPRGKVRYDKANTTGQTDYRLMRDMWSLQGIHNVKCLRGLDYILFWDYDDFLARGELSSAIHDRDFTFYMNDHVRRSKRRDVARMAQFENLAPLLPYLPDDDVKDYVKAEIRIREDDPLHAQNQPQEVFDDDDDDDDDELLGPGGINHGHHDDDDDDNDDAPSASGPRLHYMRGANAADVQSHSGSLPAVAIETDGDTDAVMNDAPLEGEQGDDELSDDEQAGDYDGDAAMGEAGQDDYELSDDNSDDDNNDEDGDDDDDDDDGHQGVFLHSPSRDAAPGRHSDTSPSLFLGSASLERDPDPGYSQPSYRYSPPEGSADAAQEASLFLEDKEDSDTEQGGPTINRPPPPQDWENVASDDESGEGEKQEESGSNDGESSDEEKTGEE